jgi:hypothetical protein
VRFKKNFYPALLALSLLLSACQPATQADPTETPLSAQAVLTAAAQTAQARMTSQAMSTPPTVPVTPSQTPPPSATFTPATTAPALGASPTLTAPPIQAGTDRVEFVADITVPDGTVFKPGEQFTKTWRLINAGTSTWTTAYALTFSSGEQMSGAATTPLTVSVPPGQTVDISINLTAPTKEGKYTGYWMLRNAAGTNFGMGGNSDGAFYVEINVSGAASTPGSGTPTATTTTGGSSDTVNDVSISVDAANVAETCPYVFTFTASFTLSEAASVTYRLEADTSFPITLPGATTASLGAGEQTVTYTLEFSQDVTGTARLHVTAPEDVLSDPVSFALSCQQ